MTDYDTIYREGYEEGVAEMKTEMEKMKTEIIEKMMNDEKKLEEQVKKVQEAHCVAEDKVFHLFFQLEKLKKENERNEKIIDNAVSLLNCLNIPSGDIYPSDEESDEDEDDC